MIDPYENLVAHICEQARKDLNAKKYDKRHRKSVPNFRLRNDARRFFLSDWFSTLTGMDGHDVLDEIDKRKQEQEKED